METAMKLKPINTLSDGKQLFAWWANNKGRGSDNCTLAVVSKDTPRSARSKDQCEVITMVRTSSWNGNVNLSKRVRKELGIEDIWTAPVTAG